MARYCVQFLFLLTNLVILQHRFYRLIILSIDMEAIYHYMWLHEMRGRTLRMVDGRSVEVISPGVHNSDAGPDFSYARLRVDDAVWVGNVEIHTRASDWFRHGHDTDPAYDSVSLHVVESDDIRISRRDGSVIPQVVIDVPESVKSVYAGLVSGMDSIRCGHMLGKVSHICLTDWFESLGVERLIEKAARIREMMRISAGDREQALFVTLARGMGFGLNSVPFELTARSIPIRYLFRHSDNVMQLEALFFGQAGMLDAADCEGDPYYAMLRREYKFLRGKYSLTPIRSGLWKYARTRPHNFPHLRLAALAAMFSGHYALSGSIMDARGDVDKLASCFKIEAGGYWREHSAFGRKRQKPLSCTLSDSSIRLLLVNVAAPFYYAMGAESGNPDIAAIGVDLLRRLPAENNSRIRLWRQHGIKISDSFESQAVLQLSQAYCDRHRCLDCRFGCIFLKSGDR